MSCKTIAKAVRKALWIESFGNEEYGKCCCCKGQITRSTFHAGHIESAFNGGKPIIENLIPMCAECNVSIGKKNLKTFMLEYGIALPPKIEHFSSDVKSAPESVVQSILTFCDGQRRIYTEIRLLMQLDINGSSKFEIIAHAIEHHAIWNHYPNENLVDILRDIFMDAISVYLQSCDNIDDEELRKLIKKFNIGSLLHKSYARAMNKQGLDTYIKLSEKTRQFISYTNSHEPITLSKEELTLFYMSDPPSDITLYRKYAVWYVLQFSPYESIHHMIYTAFTQTNDIDIFIYKNSKNHLIALKARTRPFPDFLKHDLNDLFKEHPTLNNKIVECILMSDEKLLNKAYDLFKQELDQIVSSPIWKDYDPFIFVEDIDFVELRDICQRVYAVCMENPFEHLAIWYKYAQYPNRTRIFIERFCDIQQKIPDTPTFDQLPIHTRDDILLFYEHLVTSFDEYLAFANILFAHKLGLKHDTVVCDSRITWFIIIQSKIELGTILKYRHKNLKAYHLLELGIKNFEVPNDFPINNTIDIFAIATYRISKCNPFMQLSLYSLGNIIDMEFNLRKLFDKIYNTQFFKKKIILTAYKQLYEDYHVSMFHKLDIIQLIDIADMINLSTEKFS